MPRKKAKQEPPSLNPLDELVARADVDVLDEEAPPPDTTPQTVPFARLSIEEGHNPRRVFAEEGLLDLARTIKAGGLYQPLTVRPREDRPGHYWVIAGERRYRALKLLIDQGQFGVSYSVPIYVRSDLQERPRRLVAALVENLQKESLAPLEEAEAFAELRNEHGIPTSQIAEELGKSIRHVQDRIRLLQLSDPVRQALRDEEIPVTVVRHLATAPPELQLQALNRYREAPPAHRTEEAVLRFLRSQAVPFTKALFDPQSYIDSGAPVYTSSSSVDRNPGAHNSYFADQETFLELQRRALAEQRERLQAQYAWVEEIDAPTLPQTFEATGSGPGAVILRPQSLFDVEVYTGVERRSPGPAPTPPPAARARPRPAPEPLEDFIKPPTKGRLRRAAQLRNRALQDAVAADPDAALRLALTAVLTGGPSVGLRLAPPPREQAPSIPAHIERALRALAQELSIEGPEQLLHADELDLDEESVYRALRTLPSGKIQVLFAALVASTAGVWFNDGSADVTPYSPPLLYEVAQDLRVSVVDWEPDADYLDHYTAEELRILAERFEVAAPASARKKDLVVALLASEVFRSAYKPPELAIRPEDA